MKLGNMCYGQVRISQGLHGSGQNNMSIDCFGSERPLDFRAVESGMAKNPFDVGTKYEGFHLDCDCGLDVIYVHCKYPGNKHFNRGDFVGKSTWNHLHISARFNGVWNPIYSYTDQKEVIYTSEGGIVYPYNNILLPKYQDLDASTGLPFNYNSMQIIGKFHAKLNGGIWNIRSLPNTTAPVIGKTTPNEEFDTTIIETQGALTNSTTCWIKKGEGFVSAGSLVSCTSSGDDTQCQVELTAARVKISGLEASVSELNTKNISLQAEVDSFKPVTFYQK